MSDLDALRLACDRALTGHGIQRPTDLLATVYHALGIEPHTIVYNHLKQPRELVKGQAVTALFA